MPVVAVSGVIEYIGQRRTGNNANGEWSVQNVTLQQGNDKMPVAFWNRDELPQSLKGKLVTLTSFKGQKGWTGLKTKDGKDKEGNLRRELDASKSADLVEGDLSVPNAPSAPPTPPAHQNAPNAKPDTKAAIPAGVFGGTVGMALNKSIDTMNAIGTDWFTKQGQKELWERASAIIRISQALEAGKIAPKEDKKAKTEPEPDEIPMDDKPQDVAF